MAITAFKKPTDMSNPLLNNKINSLPTAIKAILWQFVRGDTDPTPLFRTALVKSK